MKPLLIICLLVLAAAGCTPSQPVPPATDLSGSPSKEQPGTGGPQPDAAGPDEVKLFETAEPGRFKDKFISYSFENQKMIDIVRQINALTGLDMAIAPDVMERVQGSAKTFSLAARDLPVETFLNWTARLMQCHYVQGSSPDVWFVNENTRLADAKLSWKSYPAFLISVNEDPEFARGIYVEMQKGISWMRPDAKTVHDAPKRRYMVNSTGAGHKRMSKMVNDFTDRRFIPFGKVKLDDVAPSETILRSKVTSPETEETLDSLIRRIVKGTRLNIGYDSSHQAGLKKPLTIAVPLQEYSVKALLTRISEQTPYDYLHWETPVRVWLKHKDEPPHIANRYLPWDSMKVYLLWIGSVSRLIKGKDITRGIRRSVYSHTWTHPGAIIKYINSLDLLIIINQEEAVRETVRYLNFIKTFRKLPHGRS